MITAANFKHSSVYGIVLIYVVKFENNNFFHFKSPSLAYVLKSFRFSQAISFTDEQLSIQSEVCNLTFFLLVL